MKTDPVPAMPAHRPTVGPEYVLTPVHGGCDIAVATVARMLDGAAGTGARARLLGPAEPVPYGAQPVVVAPGTVYGAVCVERMLAVWHPNVPRPWLVVIADVPGPSPSAARYRLRALRSRLAGLAEVPYLGVLREAEGPEEAMKHVDVMRAAAKLNRLLERGK